MREALRTLLDRPPCLLITGHCGNWEILGYAMGLLGFRIHALYRPLDLRAADRWAREVRGRRGLFLVDKFGAAQELPRIMDRGDLVGFVADQNAGGKGVFVPFFDRLASTYKSIALLAQRYNAPIVCGQALRLGREGHDAPADLRRQTFRYKIHVSDIILPEHWADQPDPTFTSRAVPLRDRADGATTRRSTSGCTATGSAPAARDRRQALPGGSRRSSRCPG